MCVRWWTGAARGLSQNRGMSFYPVVSPLQGQIVQWLCQPGGECLAGDVLVVLEAMKMEHEVRAPFAGRVGQTLFAQGDFVKENDLLLNIEQTIEQIRGQYANSVPDSGLKNSPELGGLTRGQPSADIPARADLQRFLARQSQTLDAARPVALAKRHALGMRSARQNIEHLCNLAQHPHDFIEYGALALAAQSRRRSQEDLIANTPADGMVTGIGNVNRDTFGADASRCVVMAYDATVLAGTQGMRNHQKTDRLLDVALAQSLPVVLFAEGGGGRPGDVDAAVVAGLNVATFASFARLNGRVPVVGIVAGRCFAGNAALLGCCDVIIATRNSNIGMGGPAMVEGGGLGVYAPEQIGPSAVQHANGVIDILVDDEAKAVLAAQHYLSMFQGALPGGCSPQKKPHVLALRDVVPENRLRVYDVRLAMQHLVDAESLLQLRGGFGVGIHTALARIEGRPVGLIANNPLHLGGAIDADAADKCARFMQLCNAHGIAIVSLVDTPGFMVGPDIEEAAQVRHVSRMFVAAAHLQVPVFSVVLRKGFGLGAMAMTAGGFAATVFTVAWPSAEFGAMGLEGAVTLGFRKELEAEPNPAAREALYQRLLAQQVENGSAINMAASLEIDAVIDPATTRDWLVRGLQSAKISRPKVPTAIDTW
jgi:acetyl-CoA carboxylase carboxyltransferase component